jgi:beta-xylosidase
MSSLRARTLAIAFTATLIGNVAGPVLGAAVVGPWTPDLGNGTYQNPVLHADYSDPDAIRVGDDFWLVSSSFNHAPGLPILHSRDLVNWTIANHALPLQVPVDHFAVPRHGQGVWAPAIRHHAGKFFIYYPDPDFGIYVVTATDARGTWSAPVLVKAGKGLIDPCPLWDDDGQVYLVHGWAKSRAGISNLLTLHKLDADGTHVLDEGKIIIDANQLTGWRTLEGPKLYKHGDYYYVFAPAGGVTEGYQAVFRSKNIYGPYENRIVLEQGATPINGPHQGAWVDTAGGENWFLHFQDKGAFGRVVHLEPMAWRDDGWPAMGTAVKTGAEKGEPVLVHQKPAVKSAAVVSTVVPATTDEFDGPALGLQWQWQANPRNEWSSLKSKPGSLRLNAVRSPSNTSLYDAPNLLLQKFPAPTFTTTTVLDFSASEENAEAGLIVFGYSYGWIGLRREATGLRLVQVLHVDAQKNPTDRVAAAIPIEGHRAYLQVRVTADAKCHFAYSLDGTRFTPFGEELQATVARWVGAKVGVFSTARNVAANQAPTSHADFDWFRVTP